MNTIKYTSIDSVLFDLSTLMEEDDWNDNFIRYWAVKGAKKIGIEVMHPTYIYRTSLSNHKALMPDDFVSLNGIMIRTTQQNNTEEELSNIIGSTNSTDLDNLTYEGNNLLPINAWVGLNRKYGWMPLKATTSIYMNSILCTDDFYICPSCQYEFNVSPSGIITSTAKSGELLISYTSFPKDEEGNLLIPDNDDFKEAIYHFVLYRFHMKKAMSGDQNAKSERDYNKQEFARAAMKARALNNPDLPMMENLKNESTRLIARKFRSDQGFTNLGSRENMSY